MPKRIADNQLTHDNWDDEEEEDSGEESGKVGIPMASEQEIRGRVFKIAKRKGIAGASNTTSAFSGFGGFGSLKPTGTSFSSVLSNSNSKPTNGAINSNNNAASMLTQTSAPPSTTMEKRAKSDEYYSKLRALNESVSAWIKQHVDKNPYCLLTPVFRDYEKHLVGVESLNSENGAGFPIATKSTEMKDENEHSRNKHVSFNLTSRNKSTNATPATSKSSSSFASTSSTPSSSTFSFGLKKPCTEIKKESDFSFGSKKIETEIKKESDFSFGSKNVETESKKEKDFSFGIKKMETESKKESESESESKPAAAKFSFGSSASTSSTDSFSTKPFTFKPSSTSLGGASPGFSFGSGSGSVKSSDMSGGLKPFSFAHGGMGTSAPSAAPTKAAGDEEGEYVPPAVEVKEIKEEGTTYTKRCKLFYMKDGSWKEKGIGNIHLKPLESGKTQFIIRADTNLGTILLNILLSESIPISRSGKNMVTLVCVPNPPFEQSDQPKPEKLLLRVKTSEDADQLLAKLEEAKQ